MQNQDLHAAVDELFASTKADLERLIRIPSVSAPGYDPAWVKESAETIADLYRHAGFPEVRLLEIEGAHPAVFAEYPAPPGAPTVLLYAHHDVQPPGDEAEWNLAPYEPVERDGRLYGRGSADDKANVLVHALAFRAHQGSSPVGVKVIVEGEEEIGSAHLGDFIREYRDLLAADVIVIADSGNWRLGQPALTTSLRGLVDCVVEVRTLHRAVHSGMYGGAAPDALTALSRLLATLHDERGTVAIPGLVSGEAPQLDLTEEELGRQAGMVDGVDLVGEGTLTSRLWTRPAASVVGLDAPNVAESINQLIPVARARVSVRIAPGDDPDRAMEALASHLENNAPWGARVTVTRGAKVEAFALEAEGSAADAFRTAFQEAWGTKGVSIGVGGSIPFVAAFSKTYPEASILLTGVVDPAAAIHAPNESVDLGEFKKAALAEAIALRLLAG
ncbi:MAG: dipeptidase [Acidimicrobiia bacterium]|nr:dipeptidase [Acidimicrobiia bacterium]MDH3398411.1 dipeptidase [Acidimicrobiia bacterium]